MIKEKGQSSRTMVAFFESNMVRKGKIGIMVDGVMYTKEDIKELYEQYNILYFDGKLGKCEVSFFTKNTSYLGWYSAKNDKQGRAKDSIWIGTCVYWNKDALRRIMVHEMVHMYIYRLEKCKHDGILGHGRRFRKHCRRLRRDFDLEIQRLPKLEFINKDLTPKWWERLLLKIFDI